MNLTASRLAMLFCFMVQSLIYGHDLLHGKGPVGGRCSDMLVLFRFVKTIRNLEVQPKVNMHACG